MGHQHIAQTESHQTFRNLEISNIRTVNNRVLCKRVSKNIEKPIRGIYYPPEYHQNQELVQNVDRVYEVIVVPRKLSPVYWETTVDIEPGDVVWVTPLDALNAPEVQDENGDEYRLLSYDELIVAKRGEKVIPLNGNVLMVNMYTKTIIGIDSSLVPIQENAIVWELAEIAYKGKQNKSYVNSGDSDRGVNVKKGDIVVLDLPNKNESTMGRKYIEEDMFARFHKDKRFFYEQRPSIMAIIEE